MQFDWAFNRPIALKFACILAETYIETVVVALHAKQRRPQAAALYSVLVACFRTEVQQVLFAAERQATFRGQIVHHLTELPDLALAFHPDDTLDLLTHACLIGKLVPKLV